MAYNFKIFSPDLKEIDSGKFVCCYNLLLSNEFDKYFNDVVQIGNYTTGYFGKYIDTYGLLTVLNKDQCIRADDYTQSTFFTDILEKYECNGLLILIQ